MALENDILITLKDAAADGRSMTVGDVVDFFNDSGETPVTVSQVLAAAAKLVKDGKVKLSAKHTLATISLLAPKVEAYGVKGMKSTPWRKTFRDANALATWAEKNSAEVHGTRSVEE